VKGRARGRFGRAELAQQGSRVVGQPVQSGCGGRLVHVVAQDGGGAFAGLVVDPVGDGLLDQISHAGAQAEDLRGDAHLERIGARIDDHHDPVRPRGPGPLRAVPGTCGPAAGVTVTLLTGGVFVVPRGVEHRPSAPAGAAILMFEPTSTLSVGDRHDPLPDHVDATTGHPLGG
jgi:hypothetical protein